MAQKKYTLPRHTNIAQQGSRIGAFLIDLAIFVAITLGFFFGCFQFVFASKTKPLAANLKEDADTTKDTLLIAIEQLIDNPEKRNNMAINAKKHSQQFHLNKITDDWLDLFKKIDEGEKK